MAIAVSSGARVKTTARGSVSIAVFWRVPNVPVAEVAPTARLIELAGVPLSTPAGSAISNNTLYPAR